MSDERPLLRDLIDIPTEVHKSDFVVSLEGGIADPDKLLREYVVTPQLVDAFDRAVGLIASSIEDHASKGAYLHGSFGSGKSSFMAVLHLLLEGATPARGRDELAPVVAKLDARMSGRRFLLVPLRMTGRASLEAGVLGKYVEVIQARHPDAPLPAIYLADQLLDDARDLRSKMGDETFFAGIGGEASSGWGQLAGGWDASRFDAALAAAPGSPERSQLVSALVTSYFTSVASVAHSSGEGYVDFGEGLDAISAHAKGLGYDGIVLFLDELILWLASRMADAAFVNREGPKVALLVEAADANRPAPIVSFIARQRDLRDLVGEHLPGADQLNFSDILKWWEGRFDVITLEDRNLPTIVEKRLLAAKDASARTALDKAFDETAGRAGDRVIDILCTTEADRATFRRVYPFSPALISSLVDLSAALQRERTALRVLVQLLVDQRDRLRVGDLVPFGDLYDVIAGNDEPFTEQMKAHFASARRLYEDKLQPLLLRTHGLTEEQAAEVPDGHVYRTDDRLLKTLLLAALVPNTPAMRDLSVSRLTALNHGTVRSPIPGEERSIVLVKLRQWRVEVPELKVGDDDLDPTAALQLTDIDTDAILEQAKAVDTAAERRRTLKRLLFEAFGVAEGDSLFPTHTFLWRGTRRTVDVVFGNLRDDKDLPDSTLAAGERPKVVVDFPFDDPGYSPADDRARVETLRASGSSRTLCLLPQFLTDRSQANLGKLVVIDHVLAGDRFEQFARHLPPVERANARSQLTAQAGVLREQLMSVLRQAYGVEKARDSDVVVTLAEEEQYPTLDPTLPSARPPVATSLSDAFDKLLGQLFDHYYPAHPDFGADEIRIGELRTTLAVVERAARDRADRIDVDTADRKAVRRVANPLGLGTMHEAHYTPGRRWLDHFDQAIARDEPATITVAGMRAWLEEPRAMGLPRAVQDLLIIAFAAQTDRVFQRQGMVQQPAIDKLDDTWELRRQELPDEAEWAVAVERVSALFGDVVSPIVSAASAAQLVTRVREHTTGYRQAATELAGEIETRLAKQNLAADAARARTAVAARDLLGTLATCDEGELVHVLATAAIPTTAQAMGASIKQASAVTAALRAANWALIDSAVGLADHRAGEAAALAAELAEALSSDELVVALPAALRKIEATATDLVTQTPVTGVEHPPHAAEPGPKPPVAPGLVVFDHVAPTTFDRTAALAKLDLLRAQIAEVDDVEVELGWTLRRPEPPR